MKDNRFKVGYDNSDVRDKYAKTENEFGYGLLHKAVIHDNVRSISRLLAEGHDARRTDATGFTASELAIILKKEWLLPYLNGLICYKEKESDGASVPETSHPTSDFKQRLHERKFARYKLKAPRRIRLASKDQLSKDVKAHDSKGVRVDHIPNENAECRKPPLGTVNDSLQGISVSLLEDVKQFDGDSSMENRRDNMKNASCKTSRDREFIADLNNNECEISLQMFQPDCNNQETCENGNHLHNINNCCYGDSNREFYSDSGFSTLQSDDLVNRDNTQYECYNEKANENFQCYVSEHDTRPSNTQQWVKKKGLNFWKVDFKDQDNQKSAQEDCTDLLAVTEKSFEVKTREDTERSISICVHESSDLIDHPKVETCLCCEVCCNGRESGDELKCNKNFINSRYQQRSDNRKLTFQQFDFSKVQKSSSLLKRSNSWPFEKNCQKQDRFTNCKMAEDWEIWDFGSGQENETETDSERKTNELTNSDVEDDDIFEASVPDDKQFTASFKLDSPVGTDAKHLYVLTPQRAKSLSESLDVTPSEGIARAASENSTDDPRGFGSSCALDKSGKEEKYVFTIPTLTRSLSSSSFDVSNYRDKYLHSDNQKDFSQSFQFDKNTQKPRGRFSISRKKYEEDAKGLSKSYQPESEGKKKKGILSFFSKLRKSTSSPKVSSPGTKSNRSRNTSVSSDDGRGLSNSVSIDSQSGEQVQTIVVPKMQRSQSSSSLPPEQENTDDSKDLSSSFRHNLEKSSSRHNSTSSSSDDGFRSRNSLNVHKKGITSVRPDSGYFSPEEGKKNLSYSITFTPEESSKTNKPRNNTTSTPLFSLQEGLLPLVVGVGLGETDNTQNVVTDVLSPHSVEEHGTFKLGQPQIKISPSDNHETSHELESVDINKEESSSTASRESSATNNKQNTEQILADKYKLNDKPQQEENFYVLPDTDYSYPLFSTPSEHNSSENKVMDTTDGPGVEIPHEEKSVQIPTHVRRLNFEDERFPGVQPGPSNGQLHLQDDSTMGTKHIPEIIINDQEESASHTPSLPEAENGSQSSQNQNPDEQKRSSDDESDPVSAPTGDPGFFTFIQNGSIKESESTESHSSSMRSSSECDSKKLDIEPSPLEDSIASFENHEHEFDCTPSPAYSPSSFNVGFRLKGVKEDPEDDQDSEEKIVENNTVTERKMTMDLLKYMPPILELSFEEENETDTSSSNLVETGDKVDGQVFTRILSAENLRLHDEEANVGKTKEDILQDFVNISFEGEDEEHEENKQDTDNDVNKCDTEKLHETQTPESNDEIASTHELNEEESTFKEENNLEAVPQVEEKQGDENDEMNRSSHDTFSVEFHVPNESESDVPFTTINQNKDTQRQDNIDDRARTQKKCLWYDYSQDSAQKQESWDENKENENSPATTRRLLIKQANVDGTGTRIRRRKILNRDPSLAWDNLVDISSEVYDDEEEKLNANIDFIDETLHQELPDIQENIFDQHSYQTDDEISKLNDAELVHDDIESDEDEKNYLKEYRRDEKANSDRYLRLTPCSLLSDTEGEASDNDDEDKLTEIRELTDKREQYEVISSETIVEKTKNSPRKKVKTANIEAQDNTNTIVIRCDRVTYSEVTNIEKHNPMHAHDIVSVEEVIERLTIEDNAYEADLTELLKEDATPAVDNESSLSKILYTNKKLRKQTTEEFTIISGEERSLSSKNRGKLTKYQTTEEFTEISDSEVDTKSMKKIQSQKTEEFTILSDEEEMNSTLDVDDDISISEKYGPSMNSTLSPCTHKEKARGYKKTVELRQTSPSASSEDETKINDQHEDEDSGMDLLSEDLNIPDAPEQNTYDDWLEQIKPTLHNPELVAQLYIRLAEQFSSRKIDVRYIKMGSTAYWVIIDNDLCNFASVISYILSSAGFLKSEKIFTPVDIKTILLYFQELIPASRMRKEHIALLTFFIYKPSRMLRKHYELRLQFLHACFNEEMRQVRSGGTLLYLTQCFMKISDYFVQASEDLTENLTGEYLIPYLSEKHVTNFVLNILKYMNLLKSEEPVVTTEDLSAPLLLMNLILKKKELKKQNIEILNAFINKPNRRFKLCTAERTTILDTIKEIS